MTRNRANYGTDTAVHGSLLGCGKRDRTHRNVGHNRAAVINSIQHAPPLPPSLSRLLFVGDPKNKPFRGYLYAHRKHEEYGVIYASGTHGHGHGHVRLPITGVDAQCQPRLSIHRLEDVAMPQRAAHPAATRRLSVTGSSCDFLVVLPCNQPDLHPWHGKTDINTHRAAPRSQHSNRSKGRSTRLLFSSGNVCQHTARRAVHDDSQYVLWHSSKRSF